jgi:S-adenosylmethionine-dependent methyltransferase
MTDDIRDIADYYNNRPQSEHNRLEEHQLEFDLTWRLLDEYLPPRGKILEVGAATGRYTLGLAQRGYAITAVDLSPACLKECKTNLTKAGFSGKVQYIVSDARTLAEITDRDFDVILLMGPLYHLVLEEDRKIAVNEAFNRLRSGGVIFSAFISRYGIWGDLLKNLPELIDDQDQVNSVLLKGRDREAWPKGGFRAYFAEVAEIAPLHEAAGFETIKVVGVEPCISADDESYNKLESERRARFLEVFYLISAEPSIVGASRHLLYIGRKISSWTRSNY